MKIHPVVQFQNGIVSVTIQAQFIGDTTDTGDQQRIQAFGDPLVNLAGLFTDPAAPTFQFTFPVSELYAGITTDMQNHTARFMTALPVLPPVSPNYEQYTPEAAPCEPLQHVLDCIVTDPAHAATVWTTAIDARVQTAMTLLRAKNPTTTITDATV